MGFDHYEPDTIERVGDQVAGFRVDTGVLANLTYWHQDQWEIFNVFGVIKVLNLFAEAIVVNGAGGTQIQFNFTSTVPAIGVQAITGPTVAVGGLAALAQGLRVVYIGGAIASVPPFTATAGISDVICVAPQILGTEGGTATIGFVTTVADAASGSHQWSIFYMPMSDGAYVTNVL